MVYQILPFSLTSNDPNADFKARSYANLFLKFDIKAYDNTFDLWLFIVLTVILMDSNSVHLSVCLSVTFRYCVETA